ncbi:MAG: membrane-anchored protein YejM (alkaline phosphatase superfamily), partial [Myxococcota bacterium]
MIDSRSSRRCLLDRTHLTQLATFVLANTALVTGLYGIHGVSVLSRFPESPSASVAATFAGLAIAGPLVWFVALSAIIALLLHRFRTAFVGVIAFGAALSLVSCWFDTRLHGLLGVHLYSPLTFETLTNPGANREIRLDAGFLATIAAGLVIVVALEVGVWKASARLGRRAFGGLAVGMFSLLLATSATAMWGGQNHTASLVDRRLLAALPAWEMFAGTPPYDPARVRIDYPVGVDAQVELTRRPDILFIAAESLRADMFTFEMMPRLKALSAELGCQVAPAHHSVGHTTEYGTFGLLYGLDSYHYEPFLAADVASWPLTVLRHNGYRLMGASASALADWKGAGFMTRQFDEYVERVDETRFETDAEVAAEAKRMLRIEHAGSRFVFLFLNATHHNYLYPPRHARFEPALPSDYDHFGGDEALGRYKTELFNRYKNAVGYVDELVVTLLEDQHERIASGELVVVVTGDHGEEFWEHGMMGHAAPEFVDERVQVPMVLCGLGDSNAIRGVSSHADIWPTVLHPLGVTAPSAAFSSGRDLFSEAASLVITGGIDFPY